MSMSGLEEPPLPGLLGPVVAPIHPLERLRATPGISDARRVSLFGGPRADVEPPDREADAPGVALRVHLAAEQQVGDALALPLRPVPADDVALPGVGGAEAVHGL